MHVVAVGGSDAGISAALRARELDPTVEVTVVVADAYPNFSICGIPYYISGEVTHWRNLAHRSHADLEATGMRLRLDTLATGIDVAGQQLTVRQPDGSTELIGYDELIVGTGAVPVRPPIEGFDALGPADGVHLLHSMGDTFALTESSERLHPKTALIVGAGYVGLEMAEGLTVRGIAVTQVEMLPEVLPTVDVELGALVHDELTKHGVDVHTNATVTGSAAAPMPASTSTARPATASCSTGTSTSSSSSSASGPTPTCSSAPEPRPAPAAPSSSTRPWPPASRTSGPPATAWSPTTAFSAPPTCRWEPPPTSRAASPARTPSAATPGTPDRLGTQVVKVFDLVAARTGLREHEAARRRLHPGRVDRQPRRPQGVLPRRAPRSRIRITGDARPAGCSAPSSSAAAAPRSPSASTPTPPPCSTR